MIKVMIFIDGTWLYINSAQKLAKEYGTSFSIDYGLLPKVLGEEISKAIMIPVDIVRTFIFGSHAVNYNVLDNETVKRGIEFFNLLKEEFHYEVELFEINYRGRRIRKKDREPDDDFEPKEKCVDIALTTSLLYHAAVPNTYDIGIVVIGDRDYIPALQNVRRLGKRIAIASIKESCAPEYSDSLDQLRVKDFDIIWLNELIPKIELKYERHQEECKSPLHTGDKKVWTKFRVRKGHLFYCDECRRKYEEQKTSVAKQFVATNFEKDASFLENQSYFSIPKKGRIYRVLDDYGFIKDLNGREYFFHLTDISFEWSQVKSGMNVIFQVVKEPSEGKAGAAIDVKIDIEGQNPQI